MKKMRVPKRPLFFYSKIQNFKIAPKQPSCFFFHSEIQNFEIQNSTQTGCRSLITRNEILRVVPKWSFVFPTRKYKI